MSGYYLNTRNAPQKPYRTSVNGVTQVNGVFTPRRETSMSYRTRGNGQIVPDHQADPYAFFIRQSMDKKREKAVTKYTDRSVNPLSTISPVFLTEEGKAKVDSPIKDNGHAFYKSDQSVSTDRWAGPYTSRRSSTNTTTWDCLFAVSAVVSSLHRIRMPFQFDGSTSTTKSTFGLIPSSPVADGKYYGQKAIAELAPNSPEVSLAAILGELREGLPSLPGMLIAKDRLRSAYKHSKNKSGKALGGEYLNAQFGIIPLLADITAVYKAVNNISVKLEQYERDAGKGVRRRMSFPIEKRREVFSSSELSSQGTVIGNPDRFFCTGSTSGTLYGDSWKSTLTMSYTKKVWFTGSFTYFVPMGTSLAANINKYRFMLEKVFAPSMTLETLWQLSPWSWLIDWVTDLGSSISSYQRLSDDSLVMNYGYVMATTSKVATCDTEILGIYNPIDSVRTTYRSVRKERIRANPYGFSATTATGFTDKQWSILAALGLSRM